MNLRLPRFLRFREIQQDADAALALCAAVNAIVDDRYMPRDAHNRRVVELIECNNRELQRRRDAEDECRRLEKELMRLSEKMHENIGIAKAVDWISTRRTDLRMAPRAVAKVVSCFVSGFIGRGNPLNPEEVSNPLAEEAYRAGTEARHNHAALHSAAQEALSPG